MIGAFATRLVEVGRKLLSVAAFWQDQEYEKQHKDLVNYIARGEDGNA